MSRIYDNWERLVDAVLKKEQLWRLFHAQSRSSSFSSESSGFGFSLGLSSSTDDLSFTFSIPDSDQNGGDGGGGVKAAAVSLLRILVKDLSPVKKVSLTAPARKKDLRIQVPKPLNQHYGRAFGPRMASPVQFTKLHPRAVEGTPWPESPTNWPSRESTEYSLNPSPRMTSLSPVSRIHSGAVTPLHPRVGGGNLESKSNWPDDAKQRSHRLPLPPITVSNSSSFSHPNSAVTSPSVPRRPGRVENLAGLGSRWKKGMLLGRGTFGHVYVGFNSETCEMCAMKEVTLYSDDAKSKESATQLGQEIALLSRLKHPNIVQYYGTATVADRLYIYLEYVSGGSIHKILQEYGKLGESAIRSCTLQILSGLAYLHGKNTAHRDIKGANILVDPNGRVKLADFGMAKHITGHSGPLSFKGSPYWMAPEVIKNSNGCSLPVDIWSLGCTVLEMATSKPPWSQYEGIAAMFKIGNSKELPTIPDHLSDEGKEFVMLCLQRNPQNRPTAAQLLEHPFVKSASV